MLDSAGVQATIQRDHNEQDEDTDHVYVETSCLTE